MSVGTLRLGAVALMGGALLTLLAALAPSPEVRAFRGAYPAAARPNGTVREVALTAAPARVEVAGRPLDVWAYDGRVPGPTVRLRLGETLRVTFTNRLPQPTTIHWHGVRVPNAMDGVPWVTQPPIAPGETFVYEFTPKDAGTFWFHPHLRSSEQVERGLFGVLVVEDAAPPPYTQDVLWVLDDWLLGPTGEIDPAFNTRHDLAHDGRWGNVVTVNGARRPTLVVRPGERIRLRLLNVANGRVFAPDLSGFEATVIAMDGMYAAHPLAPGGLTLAPGNRADLDIVIPAAARGRRLAIVDRFTRQPIPLAEIAASDEEPVETPRFASPAAAHVPAWRETAALPVRAEFRLNARQGGPFGIEWTINEEAFRHEPGVAGHAGHAAHDGGDSHAAGAGRSAGAVDDGGAAHAAGAAHPVTPLPLGEWSKLRFVNESFRLHPMHVHGVFFKLLARNGVPVDEPHWRDTVLLRAQETVDVGLVPLDAGQWMLHCHILEHAESGMMTLVDVR